MWTWVSCLVIQSDYVNLENFIVLRNGMRTKSRSKVLSWKSLKKYFSCLPSPHETKVKVRALETVEEMKGKRYRQDKMSSDGKLKREV